MMIEIGDSVKVLAPFDSFKDIYVVEQIIEGQYKVSGIEGLFDIRYLEKV